MSGRAIAFHSAASAARTEPTARRPAYGRYPQCSATSTATIARLGSPSAAPNGRRVGRDAPAIQARPASSGVPCTDTDDTDAIGREAPASKPTVATESGKVPAPARDHRPARVGDHLALAHQHTPEPPKPTRPARPPAARRVAERGRSGALSGRQASATIAADSARGENTRERARRSSSGTPASASARARARAPARATPDPSSHRASRRASRSAVRSGGGVGLRAHRLLEGASDAAHVRPEVDENASER